MNSLPSPLDGVADADMETQLAAGAAFLAGFAEEMARHPHGGFAPEASEVEAAVPANRLEGLL